MKIVALDIATTTGVCVGESGAAPAAWTVNLGQGHSEEVRFSNALRLAWNLIEKNAPDLVVIEAAIGGKFASAFLIGLVACVRGTCRLKGVKCETVTSATVRKHFLGKALSKKHFPHLKPAAATKAIKQEVIDRCRIFGWEPENGDEADAMAIWDWACAVYARGHQSKPLGALFRHDG